MVESQICELILARQKNLKSKLTLTTGKKNWLPFAGHLRGLVKSKMASNLCSD